MVFGGLGDIGRKMLIENSTTFGRKWLSSIPYFQPPPHGLRHLDRPPLPDSRCWIPTGV